MVEKIFKVYYVRTYGKQPPYIHKRIRDNDNEKVCSIDEAFSEIETMLAQ